MTRRAPLLVALVIGLLPSGAACTRTPERSAADPNMTLPPQDTSARGTISLVGTSWRLVTFEGGDGTVLTPDDKTKYTMTFEPDGRLGMRIDCNRGMGTWRSSGPPQLEFGPLALTRAQCPPGSLHDQLVKLWPYVRSYVMRDGHLFLSLMADGGIYEFEPIPR